VNTPEESPNSSPGPQPHVPQLFKAASKVSLGEERGLDDPAGLTIYNSLQIALYTHTEVRQAGPLIMDRPRELLLPLPAPYRRRCSERMARIHLSASLCGRATCSGSAFWSCVLGAAELIGVSRSYSRYRKCTSENSTSKHWCENSLGGGSIFMVSGWPGKGHGSLR
jgi:hypothetical protein